MSDKDPQLGDVMSQEEMRRHAYNHLAQAQMYLSIAGVVDIHNNVYDTAEELAKTIDVEK